MSSSMASLRKVLLLLVLISSLASCMQSAKVSIKSGLWRKESTQLVAPRHAQDTELKIMLASSASAYDPKDKKKAELEEAEAAEASTCSSCDGDGCLFKDGRCNSVKQYPHASPERCQANGGQWCKAMLADPLHVLSPSTPAPATISIEFGGDAHGKGNGYLKRPEAVKSKACTAKGCEDCTSAANCWHGEDQFSWGYIVINVLKGSKFTHYVAEVWARCPSMSTSAQWIVEAPEALNGYPWRRNGELQMYVGDQRVDLQPNQHATSLPIRGGDTARLRILWFPEGDRDSYARVWLEARNVDAGVDTCMAVKECLDGLGDGSNDGYKLRNANDEQFKCLIGQRSGMTDGMKSTCEKWDKCVTNSGKKPRLLALLGVSIKQESLLEGVSAVNDTRKNADAENCVDPHVDDPESFECECAEEMTATCSGPAYADQDLETCFKSLMCQNSKICGSWKQGHCAGFSMQQRSQHIARIEKLHDGLDSAVQGKCSQ